MTFWGSAALVGLIAGATLALACGPKCPPHTHPEIYEDLFRPPLARPMDSPYRKTDLDE